MSDFISESSHYQQCISFCTQCQSHLKQLKTTSLTDDPDVSVNSLDAVATLYESEALAQQSQFEVNNNLVNDY